jgi:uncharacterized protein YjbI with pentapeptide repeats
MVFVRVRRLFLAGYAQTACSCLGLRLCLRGWADSRGVGSLRQTGGMSASRRTSLAPTAPRVPLADPSSASLAASWEDFGLGGEFDSVLLSGAPGTEDLSDISFRDCTLQQAQLGGVDLTRVRVEGCTLTSVDAPELRATRSHWRHSVIRHLRVGAADLVDSKLQAVAIAGARLGRVDLRRSIVTDVRFEDAAIEELDLEEAKATRLAFRDVRIGRLLLGGAVLKDVDLRGAQLSTVGPVQGLRGATISEWQLQALAPALAQELGLRVLGEE